MSDPNSAAHPARPLPDAWELARRPLRGRAKAVIFAVLAVALLVGMGLLVREYFARGADVPIALWVSIGLLVVALVATPVQAWQRQQAIGRLRALRPFGIILPDGGDRELRAVARERGATPPTGYGRTPVWVVGDDAFEGWWGADDTPQVTIPFAGAEVDGIRVRTARGGFANEVRLSLPGRALPLHVGVGADPEVATPIWNRVASAG